MRLIRIGLAAPAALLTLAIAGQSPCWPQTPAAQTSASSTAQPKVEIVNPVYDFGTALEGQKVTHTFTIRNAGRKDLIISGVKTSCGCTVAAPDKNHIPPGDQARIAVTFDTQFRKGHNERMITVMTNDPQNPSAVMTLQGMIRVEVDAEPSQIAFGAVRHGVEETRQVVISDLAAQAKDFHVGPISNSNPDIKVSHEPRKDGKPGALLNVTLLKTMPAGPFNDAIQVVTNRKPVVVEVFGVITGDLTLDPAQVSFGIVPSHQSAVRILRLSNAGNRAVKVLGMSSTSHSVAAKIDPITPGKEYKITVELLKNTPDGQLRGSLAIRTDDPSQPNLIVPFYAIIGSFEG